MPYHVGSFSPSSIMALYLDLVVLDEGLFRVQGELGGLPEQEKKRQTEITLLQELLTAYPKVVKEKEELQESLVNKDQELSLLRGKLDTTENMLAEARSAAMLPCPFCNDTLSSPHSFQKSLTKEDTFNHN